MATGWYSYKQQPDRTPVCQASLTTTKSSGYSNSTAVGFQPVCRHFVALQTPVSSYVASRDRQHDPVQRNANKATRSTERVVWNTKCYLSTESKFCNRRIVTLYVNNQIPKALVLRTITPNWGPRLSILLRFIR